MLVQIVGPLPLGALFEPNLIDDDFADRLVDRLIGGYASDVSSP